MTLRAFGGALSATLVCVVAACADDDAATTAAPPVADASAADAPASADGSGRDPNQNCIKPGTPNNDQGIGGYCETNKDCVKGKSLCTGEFGAPPNAWFCTRPCADDPNCGDGLYCANDPRGVACVPIACGIADAGAEASSDAASD